MKTNTEYNFLLQEGETVLIGATDRELIILGRTKKRRTRKKYTDRIERRMAVN